jgi:hypothetical protein
MIVRQFLALAREAIREGNEHPALWLAIIMRPMGYRWESHKWVGHA